MMVPSSLWSTIMHDLLFCKFPATPDFEASRQAALCENPANALSSPTSGRQKRALGQFSKFWKPGRTLRIAFMNEPSADHKKAVETIARQWLRYAYLKFDFVDGKQGEIRIFTDIDSNHSHVGTDALLVDSHDGTMALGAKPDDPMFARTVLHEFGHVLGLLHEHQHPQANIPWDKPKVYAYFAAKGVDQQTVDLNLFEKTDKAIAKGNAYDPTSIMHYAVLQEQTIGDWEVGFNQKLSKKDRAFARRIYPRPSPAEM